ncbi:PulJ/GspJ family protein [Luteimonas marina]|uniref:PulJ/GspJ family protein n=1 Tax=Luteimonas marina TaxID=488485 RepID=UPI001315092D|nr:type II secretion system protein [Luteimonas marina]
MPKLQSGLTLLEMIVVLMIAGMALALGFQSLGQWRRADTAISSMTGQARQAVLTQHWLHDSVRSLTPVEDVPFQGTDSALSGISLNPTLSSQGGATSVAWRIEQASDGTSLVLDEQGTATTMALPGVVSAHFAYYDPEGKESAQWPPPLGVADALPMSVALFMTTHTGDIRVWGTSIAGIRNPVVTLYELERD